MAIGLNIPNVGKVFQTTVSFVAQEQYVTGGILWAFVYQGVHYPELATPAGGVRMGNAGLDVGHWDFKYGNPAFTSYGIISEFAYCTIKTSKTGSGSGSVFGATERATEQTKIRANPGTYSVVTRIGETEFKPELTSKTSDKGVERSIYYTPQKTDPEEVTIDVVFEYFYTITFSANTTDSVGGMPEDIKPCVKGVGYEIPDAVPNREGYLFAGWSLSADGTGGIYHPGDNYTHSKNVSKNQKVTFYAVWSQATLTYDANGGVTTPASQTYYGEIILAEGIHRDGRSFLGWKIGDTIYPARAKYNLTSNVVAVAMWTTISIRNTNTIAGRLSLYNLTANKKVADENANGYLAYSGEVGAKYRVDCTLSGLFYDKKGVYVDGEHKEPYIFVFNGTDVVVDYTYTEKPLYSVAINSAPAGNNASVSSPAAPDKDGKYVEGRAITVTGVPAAGYKLKAASIFNEDRDLPIGDFDDIENNSFTIDKISCNLRISCVFVKIDYVVSAAVDGASANAIQSATAKMGDANVRTATYGDEVTFEAKMLNGYQFGGWYDGSRLVSEANPYAHTMTGDINLVAKAKVSVTLDIEHFNNKEGLIPNKSCSLVVDGIEVFTPHPFDVVLGGSFSYALTLGALTADTNDIWKFDAWYSGETVQPYGKEGTITPVTDLSMTARVTSAPIERTLSISFVNEETNKSVEVSEETVAIHPAPKSKVVNGSTITFVFEGTQEVQLILADEIAANESLAFSKIDIGGVEIADNIFTHLLNGDFEATAYYGSQGARVTLIDFATGSDRTMGEVAVDDQTSATETMPISVEKNRGEVVAITARPKNGYRFVGWYINVNGIGTPYYASADVVMKVTTNRTLFAKFIQDPNAVYEWEGSNENKMMSWRSKTYESTKPFNPSSCRADTTGYPLWSLSVDMFSAPNTKPTAIARLTNIRSQDSRRLPIRRMERFMQISLENNDEVDAIVVSTSTMGLRA